jgi:hypothetical protein
MKKSIFYHFGLLVVLFCSCGPTDTRKSFNTPVEYNDYIINALNELDANYAKTLNNPDDKENSIKLCGDLVKNSDATIVKLNAIQPYDGDSSLAMVVKDFATYMKTIGQHDLPDFLNKLHKPDRNDNDQAEIDKIASKLDQTYDNKWVKIDATQQTLANKFNFSLTPRIKTN